MKRTLMAVYTKGLALRVTNTKGRLQALIHSVRLRPHLCVRMGDARLDHMVVGTHSLLSHAMQPPHEKQKKMLSRHHLHLGGGKHKHKTNSFRFSLPEHNTQAATSAFFLVYAVWHGIKTKVIT